LLDISETKDAMERATLAKELEDNIAPLLQQIEQLNANGKVRHIEYLELLKASLHKQHLKSILHGYMTQPS
jgi:hypothetical protein